MSATLLPPSAWRKARKISSSECPFFATCVSSSISSTGPRLPLQTQLIAGSLFGFWVTAEVIQNRDDALANPIFELSHASWGKPRRNHPSVLIVFGRIQADHWGRPIVQADPPRHQRRSRRTFDVHRACGRRKTLKVV